MRLLPRMRWTLAAAVAVAALAAGCSSGTDPTSPDPDAVGEGTIDPGVPVFVLTLEGGADSARPVRVELVGENLVVDETEETLSVDVSLVNRGRDPLPAPLLVRIGAFRPRTVEVVNPDVLEIPNQVGTDPPMLPYGFDYTESLGDDTVLDPDEQSGAKTWTFRVPGLVPFSFAARAVSGVDPAPRPHVGGFVWHDANRNGVRDRGEGPGAGAVEVVGPGGSGGTGFVHPSGHWLVPVELPGLHRVTFFDPTDGPRQWLATTPNPLEVVLLPDPDGAPQSFRHADFGVTLRPPGDGPVPVLLTERLPDQIPQDAYGLRGARLDGDVLTLGVQYGGGCRPEHPLVLWASSDFRSDRPETWMLLAHDDLGDPCEALIGRTVAFDLDPIRQAYLDTHGTPHAIVVHFLDFAGNRHTFELGP